MSKQQWGHGYYKGRSEILKQIKLPEGLMLKIEDLREREANGLGHFDSYECDKAEVDMELDNLGICFNEFGYQGEPEHITSCFTLTEKAAAFLNWLKSLIRFSGR